MVLDTVREWRLIADAYVSIGTILLGSPDQAQKLDSGIRSSMVVMSQLSMFEEHTVMGNSYISGKTSME